MIIDKLHFISTQNDSFTHLDNITGALAAGCTWIQLRIKDQPEQVVLEQALAAKTLCDRYGAKLIVNDYPEIALKAGAYGLHLGLQDTLVEKAREVAGDKLIIGGTANTFEDILQRVTEGVDYIGLGPFRFTATKAKLSPLLGLQGYTSIMNRLRDAQIQIPVIAIGGIELSDVRPILHTGVYGVAVSGAITRATDKSFTVKNMFKALEESSFVH